MNGKDTFRPVLRNWVVKELVDMMLTRGMCLDLVADSGPHDRE